MQFRKVSEPPAPSLVSVLLQFRVPDDVGLRRLEELGAVDIRLLSAGFVSARISSTALPSLASFARIEEQRVKQLRRASA